MCPAIIAIKHVLATLLYCSHHSQVFQTPFIILRPPHPTHPLHVSGIVQEASSRVRLQARQVWHLCYPSSRIVEGGASSRTPRILAVQGGGFVGQGGKHKPRHGETLRANM